MKISYFIIVPVLVLGVLGFTNWLMFGFYPKIWVMVLGALLGLMQAGYFSFKLYTDAVESDQVGFGLLRSVILLFVLTLMCYVWGIPSMLNLMTGQTMTARVEVTEKYATNWLNRFSSLHDMRHKEDYCLVLRIQDVRGIGAMRNCDTDLALWNTVNVADVLQAEVRVSPFGANIKELHGVVSQ